MNAWMVWQRLLVSSHVINLITFNSFMFTELTLPSIHLALGFLTYSSVEWGAMDQIKGLGSGVGWAIILRETVCKKSRDVPYMPGF